MVADDTLSQHTSQFLYIYNQYQSGLKVIRIIWYIIVFIRLGHLQFFTSNIQVADHCRMTSYSCFLSTSREISLRRINGSVNGGLYCINGESTSLPKTIQKLLRSIS